MTDIEGEAALLSYINSTPAMQSVLYDCDLMPEQVARGTFNWRRMLTIAYHWRERETGEREIERRKKK